MVNSRILFMTFAILVFIDSAFGWNQFLSSIPINKRNSGDMALFEKSDDNDGEPKTCSIEVKEVITRGAAII